MPEHETRLRVRYAETDQMGVAYYANYAIWMEVGRVELCRALGVRYRDMEEQDDVLLVVAEIRCRYFSPARYDDEVIVKTWVAKAGSRMVTFGYEMRRVVDNVKLAAGETRHIFCTCTMKSRRLPDKYHAIFALTADSGSPGSRK